VIRPKTILDWFRKLAARRYGGSAQRRGSGRPRKASDTRELGIRLANENIGRGSTKLRDAIRGLQIDIGRTTVANILTEAGVAIPTT
jgi:hypothetical protein